MYDKAKQHSFIRIHFVYRYSVIDDTVTDLNEPVTTPLSTARTSNNLNTSTTPYPTMGPTSGVTPTNIQTVSTSANINNIQGILVNTTLPTSTTTSSWNAIPTKSAFRKGGVIFPSVKNKPAVVNNTFTSDIFTLKDVKVSPK